MAGGGPVGQVGNPGAQSMLSSSMQSMRRINPYGGGNPYTQGFQNYSSPPPSPPSWMQQAQEAQQKFQQSSPYTEYMNKQRALQEEFENSQGFKDFQTQMQGFQKQQQEYRPPFSPYGGMYGGLGRMFF